MAEIPQEGNFTKIPSSQNALCSIARHKQRDNYQMVALLIVLNLINQFFHRKLKDFP